MSVTIYAEEGSAELNVANGNFVDLWGFLGLPFDWCGSVSGTELRAAVFAKKFERDELHKPTVRDGNLVDCGRDAAQVNRYFDTLEQIASEAIMSKSVVSWS